MQPSQPQTKSQYTWIPASSLSQPHGHLRRHFSPRSSFAHLTEDMGGPEHSFAIRSTKLHLSGGHGFLDKPNAVISPGAVSSAPQKVRGGPSQLLRMHGAPTSHQASGGALYLHHLLFQQQQPCVIATIINHVSQTRKLSFISHFISWRTRI